MATKDKLVVDNLPLTIDGKIEMVPRRQYANHKASDLTIKKKVDIKKGAINDMIDMIVEGKELDEAAEDYAIWQSVYEIVKADIETAQEKNREAVEAANQAAEDQKLKELEKSEGEKQLALVASQTDVASTFATLGEHFDLGNMDRCIPKEGTTVEQMMSALVAGLQMENFSNWAKGDLVAELEARGHETAMVTLCEQTGIPYKSIYRMAVTARNVPPDSRKPGVGFTTYAEIAMAKLSPKPEENTKAIAALIEKVGERPLDKDGKVDEAAAAQVITTAQEARQAVLKAQGKTPPVPDPNKVDYDKDKFFVVNYDGGSAELAEGFPASLANTEGVDILHAKTGRKSYDYKPKTGESKWTPLGKFVHPAPEPKPTPEPAAKKGNPAAATAVEKKAKGKKK